jgi:hypothetical protein
MQEELDPIPNRAAAQLSADIVSGADSEAVAILDCRVMEWRRASR